MGVVSSAIRQVTKKVLQYANLRKQYFCIPFCLEPC
jgi:hypothetical protein